MEDQIVLEGDFKKPVVLGSNTLVFALDETGHEDFLDKNYPVFGIGGCGFMVSDYRRLIESPFNYMCEKFFPDINRPFHTTDVAREITTEQIDSLNHLFTKFQFFRIAVVVNQELENNTDFSVIQLVARVLLDRVRDIAKITPFERVVIIYEDSERIGVEVMKALSNYSLKKRNEKINVELALMPKKSGFVGLELADLIIHTAGRQGNHYLKDKEFLLPDYKNVFQGVDKRLISFRQFGKVEEIK